MDYQGNANKNKEDKPDKSDKKPEKFEKVITGEVVQKPKTLGRKFKETFFGGDLRVATRFVLADVLLPALRNMIVDATAQGMERLVYPESRYRNRSVNYHPRIRYDNPMHFQRDLRSAPDPRRSIRTESRITRQGRRDIGEIIIPSREDAERVVERLTDIIETYEVASLADLYDLLDLPSSHVDNKWGWTYLINVDIRQVREGYLIDLPSLEEI